MRSHGDTLARRRPPSIYSLVSASRGSGPTLRGCLRLAVHSLLTASDLPLQPSPVNR